jgi:transposase
LNGVVDEDRLRRHDLTDAEWARLESLLPARPRQGTGGMITGW